MQAAEQNRYWRTALSQFAAIAVLYSATLPSAAQSPDVQITGPGGSGTGQVRFDANPSGGGYEVARRVAPGDFQIAIKVFNLEAEVWHIHFDLYFDSTAVSYVIDSATEGPSFGPEEAAGVDAPGPGHLHVSVDKDPCTMFGGGPVGPGSYTIATLTFTSTVTPDQSGFDVVGAQYEEWVDCSFSNPVFDLDTEIAKGVVVIGDATLSCLNVNTTDDLPSIDLPSKNPDCNPALGIGDISLRSAIQLANALSGSNRPTFWIDETNPTIVLGSPIEALSDTTGPTFLDGATQFAGMVQVQGAGGPTFSLTSNNNTLKKLSVITNFGAEGVRITGSTNKIFGCKVGVNANDGFAGNLKGIVVAGGSGNQIGGILAGEGSTISGNSGPGVELIAPSSGTLVRGNKLGPTSNGLGNAGNLEEGVLISGSSGNTIGGSTAATRNIISGNSGNGISIFGPAANGNMIFGNYIGLAVNGMLAMSNLDGVLVSEGANNQIGGVGPGEGNVISSNSVNGVILLAGASGNLVRNNKIGTDAGGTIARGNTLDGVQVLSDAGPDNTIGGEMGSAGNLISGNAQHGVHLSAPDQIVQGNFIGTTLSGAAPLGNVLDGVIIDNAANNLVGGASAELGNLISKNGGDGVLIQGAGSTGNGVHSNIIGLNAAGTAKLANAANGINIMGSADQNIIGAPGTGNLISGNALDGVHIEDSNENKVQSNTIGLNLAGTAALGNGAGVQLADFGAPCTNNRIGSGSVFLEQDPGYEALGNVIAGNNGPGVEIYGALAFNNSVKHNVIGTSAAGAPFGNAGHGVLIRNGAAYNILDSNQILANTGDGVRIDNPGADNNHIISNTIGTAFLPNQHAGVQINNGPTGTNIVSNTIRGNVAGGVYIETADGNFIRNNFIELNGLSNPSFEGLGGVILAAGLPPSDGSSGNYIGGVGYGNVISGNAGDGVLVSDGALNFIVQNIIEGNTNSGVRVSGSPSNPIHENSMTANGLLGIELEAGGNGDQPAPVLSTVSADGSGTTISGTLTSTTGSYTLEFFANGECDPTGFGEGAAFLGAAGVTVPSGGSGPFTASVSGSFAGAAFITVTATDSANNTSEFSACLAIAGDPDADADSDGVTNGADNCPTTPNTDQADSDSDGHGNLCDNCPLDSNSTQTNTDGDAFGDACDPDDDNDTVLDGVDNCPLIPNTLQTNTDSDGMGDACDTDDDNDGLLDAGDNCPLVSNAAQTNTDGDSLGDACDADDDNDGVTDGSDNCPLVSNAMQTNADGDSLGDVCDPDDDNDGVADGSDNCPLISNASQTDTDEDAIGDACDSDDDNDGVPDGADNCPLVSNAAQADADSDSLGDDCDPDDDNDGVVDGSDNCPLVSNAIQTDTDGDAVGDACDADDDNDGMLDGSDNCPLVVNADQSDADSDGTGNACDADDDNDGVPDGADNCPLGANTDQADCDGDGIGDECEPDCDGNGTPDGCDVDCNHNGTTDACDISGGTSADCNANGVPDECELNLVAAVNTPVGDRPMALVANDLDGDGDADLAVLLDGPRDVAVLLNNGDASFAAAVMYSSPYPLNALAAGDLDGDNDTDLAVAIDAANDLWLLLNNGDGTFAAEMSFNIGSGNFTAITTRDLDGDGDLDLALTNDGPDTVTVLKNNGNATFAAAVSYDVGHNPRSIACGDLDGDGDLDLVTANNAAVPSERVSVLMNNGNGTFAPAVNYTAGSAPISVVVADLDLTPDGDLDIAVANENSGNVTVMVNSGNGIFPTAVTLGAADVPSAIAAGDLTGDGENDLVVANEDFDNLSILLNDCSGFTACAGLNFLPPQDFTAGDRPRAAAIVDLDGDGDFDVAAANYGSDNVSVLRNAYIPPPGADCNQNEVDDACDIATGAARDDNANGIPDGCETLVVNGDFDGDGDVDGADIAGFVACFLAGSATGPCAAADMGGDGDVDDDDLALFIALLLA